MKMASNMPMKKTRFVLLVLCLFVLFSSNVSAIAEKDIVPSNTSNDRGKADSKEGQSSDGSKNRDNANDQKKDRPISFAPDSAKILKDDSLSYEAHLRLLSLAAIQAGNSDQLSTLSATLVFLRTSNNLFWPVLILALAVALRYGVYEAKYLWPSRLRLEEEKLKAETAHFTMRKEQEKRLLEAEIEKLKAETKKIESATAIMDPTATAISTTTTTTTDSTTTTTTTPGSTASPSSTATPSSTASPSSIATTQDPTGKSAPPAPPPSS